MAWTLDGIVDGMRKLERFQKTTGTMEAAGVWHSLWYAAGRPGAGAAPSSGLGGGALSSTSAQVSGQIPFADPVSGQSRLAKLSANAALAGTLLLCDRLWDNSGFTVTTTTAQTVNSVTWPSRDKDGATTGEDVLIGLEVSAATTNAGAVTNCTMSYDDTGGNGATATPAYNLPATMVQGTFVPFNLAAGDTGVQQVNSLTLGTSLVTGTVHLVAYRVLDQIEINGAGLGNNHDAIASGFPRIYDGAVPFLIWVPTATTSLFLSGSMGVTQGAG